MIELVKFALGNKATRVAIGNDGPYLIHPWWERGLRAQVKVLAAAKPTKIKQEKTNA